MTTIRVQWTRDNRDALSSQIKAAAVEALREIAEDCLEKSNRIVPLEDGVLSDSGFVEVNPTATGAEGQVAYSTPYAVVQHEDTSLSHDPGRESHYLEKTVHGNTREWEQHLATRLRGGLR